MDEEQKGISENASEKDWTGKMRENPWMLSTIVLGLVVLTLLFFTAKGGLTGATISENEAGEKLLKLYESNGVEGLTLSSVKEISGLYEINFEYDGAIVPIYLTKDGKYAGSLSPISLEDSSSSSSTETTEVVKSDKPKVELFVMTHCPYGTQAEKGFINAIETLGENVDASIKFVHYFMHEPEEEETSRQVCIREEQEDKYLDYLKCFLEGDGVESNGYVTNGKNPETCMAQVGIDVAKVNQCVDSGKWEDYYDADSELSEGYGVQGSPTLVINGVIVNSGRAPQTYLDTICSAFNNEPEACSVVLSSETPSVYFGWDVTESSATGVC